MLKECPIIPSLLPHLTKLLHNPPTQVTIPSITMMYPGVSGGEPDAVIWDLTTTLNQGGIAGW